MDPAPLNPRQISSSMRRYLVSGTILLTALVGIGIWRHTVHSVPRHLRTVEPHVLYRSAWPTGPQLGTLVKRYGIRTVVNLCQPGEEVSCLDGNWEREAEQCRQLGVTLIHVPLAGNSPPTAEQAKAWLQLFQTPEKLPVLVHCAQGVIRTNGMVAVYCISVQGIDNRSVLSDLPDFGHDLFAAKRQRLNDFILTWPANCDGNSLARDGKEESERVQ